MGAFLEGGGKVGFQVNLTGFFFNSVCGRDFRITKKRVLKGRVCGDANLSLLFFQEGTVIRVRAWRNPFTTLLNRRKRNAGGKLRGGTGRRKICGEANRTSKKREELEL